MRVAYACIGLALVLVGRAELQAQVDAAAAKNLGLESAWKSQAQLPTVGTGVVSSHLWADAQNPRQFAVVKLENQSIRVSAESLDKAGKPLGLEAAKTLARQQAAKMLGRNDGFQVIEVSVPRIKLVVITSDGMAQAMDAETGKFLWAQACGHSSAPAFPGAVSQMGVSVIHGEDLYLLDWETGKPLMNQRLRYSTSNAIAVCNDIAYVSDFTGRVQAYGLGARSQLPWSYVMQGRAVGPTANFANQAYCAIASDAGFVYVYAAGETPSVYIRYETTSPLTGSLTAGNNAFYAGTAEGLVSKIALDNRLGTIKWELRLSTTVTAPPLVVGKYVFVASESGELVAIEDETGIAAWTSSTAGVRQPLALAGGTLYCLSLTGQVEAINAETGAVIARTRPLALSRPIPNQLTDRLYLITKYGQVQCLRPIGASLPTMITPVVTTVGENEATGLTPASVSPEPPGNADPFNFGSSAAGDPFGNAPAAAGSTPTPTPGADPFGGTGGTADPFGGTGGAADPFGGSGTGDPFGGATGGAADPFGGSGSGTPAGGTPDPFGGSSDPFGGSGN